jgi:hypothetical protein
MPRSPARASLSTDQKAGGSNPSERAGSQASHPGRDLLANGFANSSSANSSYQSDRTSSLCISYTELYTRYLSSPLSPEEIRAAAEVHRQLGPGKYSDAVVESFLERVDKQVAERVDQRIATPCRHKPRSCVPETADPASRARRPPHPAGRGGNRHLRHRCAVRDDRG